MASSSGRTPDAHTQPSSLHLVRSNRRVESARTARHSDRINTEPLVHKGAVLRRDIKAGVGDNSLRVVPRGAHQIAIFWDVHPDTARQFADHRWAVSVRTSEGEKYIHVLDGARSWYVDVTSVNNACEIRIGPIDAEGGMTVIACWTMPTMRPGGTPNPTSALPAPSTTMWATATIGEVGSRLEPAGDVGATADTEALLRLCQAPAGPSSTDHPRAD